MGTEGDPRNCRNPILDASCRLRWRARRGRPHDGNPQQCRDEASGQHRGQPGSRHGSRLQAEIPGRRGVQNEVSGWQGLDRLIHFHSLHRELPCPDSHDG